MRDLCQNLEEGEQLWTRFQASIEPPSAGASDAPVSPRRAQAEAQVGDEGAAFTAFMATSPV